MVVPVLRNCDFKLNGKHNGEGIVEMLRQNLNSVSSAAKIVLQKMIPVIISGGYTLSFLFMVVICEASRPWTTGRM